jgi:tetratricopeptide (TPR) repeat protein
MKKAILFLGIMMTAASVWGQAPADLQKMMEQAKAKMKSIQKDPKIAQKMKQAQQELDEFKKDTGVQNELKRAKAQLQSLKEDHPEIGDVEIPDLNNMNPQMPDFDSISRSLGAASNKLNEMTQLANQAVPKQNLFHHADKLPGLSESAFVLLARVLLKKADAALDAVQHYSLNTILKDTSINTTDLGANFLALGFSKNAAVDLICHGILKNPKNIWAANDLGAFFRTQMDYEKALQCFFYANSLDAGKAAVNTNIGWASAYYGDFGTAKKYFEKALAIDEDCNSALEGEANIAFAEGDIVALFQCLAKEVKYVGGNGNASGGGPSTAFASLCGGTAALNEGDLDHQTSDPTGDHTFDNPNPNDSHSSDIFPGGQVDDIQYTRYKPVFINDAKQITQGPADGFKQNKASLDELKKRSASLTAQLRSMKPLVQAAYEEGEYMIYPASYRNYVEMLTPIDVSFEKRTAWWITKLSKKSEPYRKQVIQRDVDMMKQYIQALAACGGDERCGHQVMCTWLPRMYKAKNADLAYIIKIWNEYYDHTAKAIQWYIDASAPFIYEVKNDEWNKYLNAKREFEVRKAIIQAYGMWTGLLGDINTPIVGYIQMPVPDCPATKMFAGIQAPDPYARKVHHIYEFKDPNCFKIEQGMKGFFEDELTCHGEKVSFGLKFKSPPGLGQVKVKMGGFAEHITDPLKASDLGFDRKIGGDLSVSMGISKIGASSERKVEATFLDGHLVQVTTNSKDELSVFNVPVAGESTTEIITAENTSEKTVSLGPSSIIPKHSKDDLTN